MNQAKENIAKLVEKYNRLKAQNKIKTYNEAQTRKDFIDPLFEYLGWDIRNTRSDNEVITEENILGDRVDMAFRINGITKFFLEAKPLKADLDIEKYARQSINYSWNKAVNWAVLTDFESIKVFYSQGESRNIRDKMVFELSCDQYIYDFNILKLLSRESFAINALDEFAEKIGKKSKSLTVNEKLFGDLRKAREILTEAFGSWSENWKKGFDKVLLDEGVQRILDRLIFIRVLEDRNLEEPILRPLSRAWEDWKIDRSGNKQLFHLLINKFRELDDTYNSNLFIKHACEDWEEYSEAVKKVIDILYGNDIYGYNFKEIPADILGGVYESYLGYIAQNPIKVEAKSGKLLQVESKKEIKVQSRQKRKEHGIYYTPKFIVDYIVKNTLGEKLKEAKSENDLKKIKVLDPACGSGSFLTKALETINDKYKDFSNPGDQYTKTQILLSNIYGVDLDTQAVELAKLNLLLATLDKKEKLPNIENVQVGNSLISGDEKELEKYFGKNWREKESFNWEEKFPDVFKQDGFDVIIGNPPYVVLDSDNDDLRFFKDNYKSSHGGKVNLYKLFIEKSINLLNDNGYLGFICPSNYISSADSYELRKILLKNTRLIEIIEYTEKDKVFANVIQALTTIVVQKSSTKNDQFHLVTNKQGEYLGHQANFEKNSKLEFISHNLVIEKMNKLKDKISDMADCYQGEINVSTKKDLFSKERGSDCLPLLRGNLIKTYNLIKSQEYCPISANLRGHYGKKRIVFQEVSNQQQPRRIKAVVAKNVLCGHSTNYALPKREEDFDYMLALLNSKLINYYFSYFNNTNHIPVGEIKKIPIPITEKQKRDGLAKLAGKMLESYKQLQSISEDSDKWNKLKEEIEKTDKEIDQKVYELYGLTEEEIKIVEDGK